MEMGTPEINQFLTHLGTDKIISTSTQNQALSALLFLYENILQQIIVRDGKGEDDRITTLPDTLIQPLQLPLRYVKAIHEKDLADGFGSVYLPYALDRKYSNANKEWIWQYLFSATDLSKDPRTGIIRRHHFHESTIQQAVKEAARVAKISKHVTPTRFATPSPLIFCKTVTISARFRNCSGTKMKKSP